MTYKIVLFDIETRKISDANLYRATSRKQAIKVIKSFRAKSLPAFYQKV